MSFGLTSFSDQQHVWLENAAIVWRLATTVSIPSFSRCIFALVEGRALSVTSAVKIFMNRKISFYHRKQVHYIATAWNHDNNHRCRYCSGNDLCRGSGSGASRMPNKQLGQSLLIRWLSSQWFQVEDICSKLVSHTIIGGKSCF